LTPEQDSTLLTAAYEELLGVELEDEEIGVPEDVVGVDMTAQSPLGSRGLSVKHQIVLEL
jgi:hypothetical protein